MKYFSTMNLPSPGFKAFEATWNQYQGEDITTVFQDKMAEWLGSYRVFSLSNCFTALGLAIMTTRTSSRNKCVIAAQCYRRTLDIVKWSGLEAYLIDIDIDTLAMSLSALEEALKQVEGIASVLLQHPMVNGVDITPYLDLCSTYSVPVIVDSVEVAGHGRHTSRGSNGRSAYCEAFSLHPSKVLNGCEGGILSFNNKSNANHFMSMLREHIGVDIKDFANQDSHNLLGLASLGNYNNSTKIFQNHYDRYRCNLKATNLVGVIEYELGQNVAPNYKSVLLKLSDSVVRYRERLLEELNKKHIGARPYYPLHKDVVKQASSFPNALKSSKDKILMPIGHTVSVEDIDWICSVLLHALESYE